MRRFNLIEYEILGEGLHCEIKIYVAGIYIGTLDTGTKHNEEAEQELAKYIKKQLFPNLTDEEDHNLSGDEH